MHIDKADPPILFKHGFEGVSPSGAVPQAEVLGMEFLSLARNRATARVPYSDKLIGNPETGVIHGGVITTLLDHCSGTAIYCALTEFRGMATLDLRIDYMRPATPRRDIFCMCHCYRITRNIAFVNGTAYHTDPDDPIATSRGVFMLTDLPAPPAEMLARMGGGKSA